MSYWSPNYTTACRIQDRILDALGIRRQWQPNKVEIVPEPKDLKPGEIASLAKAWDCLEERKSLIRMKPKPKPVDVSGPKKSSRILAVPKD